MDHKNSKAACRSAVDLIEEQLAALSMAAALLLHSTPAKGVDAASGATAKPVQLKRKPRSTRNGLPDTLVPEGALAPGAANGGFDLQTKTTHHENAPEKMNCLRVLIGNALLAVEFYLKEHHIASSRTPQIQFLGHLCNAILNANTFRIDTGYIPGASFEGLVIDSTLDGKPVFGDGVAEGFLEFGDAV